DARLPRREDAAPSGAVVEVGLVAADGRVARLAAADGRARCRALRVARWRCLVVRRLRAGVPTDLPRAGGTGRGMPRPVGRGGAGAARPAGEPTRPAYPAHGPARG